MEHKYRFLLGGAILFVAFVLPQIIFFSIVDVDRELRRDYVKDNCTLGEKLVQQTECFECCDSRIQCSFTGKTTICYNVCINYCYVYCCRSYLSLTYENGSGLLLLHTAHHNSSCYEHLGQYTEPNLECWHSESDIKINKPRIGTGTILMFTYAAVGILVAIILIVLETVFFIRRRRYAELA